jgi:hypothetical protein
MAAVTHTSGLPRQRPTGRHVGVNARRQDDAQEGSSIRSGAVKSRFSAGRQFGQRLPLTVVALSTAQPRLIDGVRHGVKGKPLCEGPCSRHAGRVGWVIESLLPAVAKPGAQTWSLRLSPLFSEYQPHHSHPITGTERAKEAYCVASHVRCLQPTTQPLD